MEKQVFTNLTVQELSNIISLGVSAALDQIEQRENFSKRWIRPYDAAILISHSEAYVRKLVYEGVLSHCNPDGDMRIDLNELNEWMEANKIKHKP